MPFYDPPAYRLEPVPFVPGVRVELLEPAPGHLEFGIVAGSRGTVHAGRAHTGTGLVVVRFDSGKDFWCDPESLAVTLTD